MKKSYVTTMPDDIGAFLKASRCFASLGINITRVSYNKAIDVHTLFIDAEGTEEQLAEADKELREIGYIHPEDRESTVMLAEFILRDVPGAVTRSPEPSGPCRKANVGPFTSCPSSVECQDAEIPQ